jgi:hypothetical protein
MALSNRRRDSEGDEDREDEGARRGFLERWVRLGDAWLGPRVSGTAHGFGSVLSVLSVASCESNGLESRRQAHPWDDADRPVRNH